MALLTIALLAVREAARRRLLTAAAALTIVLVGLTGWSVSRLVSLHDAWKSPSTVALHASIFVILLAWGFSMVLAVGAAFLAAPAIASEVETGLILAVLPRPIRRSDFVLGKWLGLALLLGAYIALTAALEFATIKAVTGYLPPHPIAAALYLMGEAFVLMTLALFASTRVASMTGGIIAIALFGVAWIAGMVQTIAIAFNNQSIETATAAVGLLLPTDAFWRGAVFSLEPSAVVATANAAGRSAADNTPFGISAPPSTALLLWSFGWTAVVLSAAVLTFNHRDL
ncbi:MAG: ABC transporter permease [Candidatus Eremiobacteraeota bacterium]|nr:ABC transporter permease [Candidatus Eremiobacteraeota bacterium]MBC5826816.1 ABC transporter permease [Candidatus Eremiobacteraeota bacterium]